MDAHLDRSVLVSADGARVFDLSPALSDDRSELFQAKVAGLFLGSLSLFGATALVVMLVSGQVFPGLTDGVLGAVLMLLAFAALSIGTTIHRFLNPYYVSVRVSPNGVTFVSPRASKTRHVDWDRGAFHLRLFQERWGGIAGQCCDYTDAFAPKALTEESLDAILASARARGVPIGERKAWSGVRTYFILGDKR